MARQASKFKNKKIEKKQCLKCEKEKKVIYFYKSTNPLHNGYLYWCKQCIKDFVNIDDIESVKNILMQFDLPFLYDVWITAMQSKGETLGSYIRMLGLKQHRDLRWKDSRFDLNTKKRNELEKIKAQRDKYKFEITNEVIERWGDGYKKHEYLAFERKYAFLKGNYPERTAMHTEALLNYIRYRVKEELSTAEGLVKEAESWGKLAQKAAQDAKINPSQLSKADLQDGLSAFGELSRAVELAKDVIDILPRFREKPKDKVDVNIWAWINYVRDLKGLPPVEYAEIYRFYDVRKKEYESQMDDLLFIEKGEDVVEESGAENGII